MWPISPDPVDPSESIAWLRDRAPILRSDWDMLNASSREKAFMVSGVAQLDLVAEVHRAVDTAVAHGGTLEEFKKAVGQKLEAEWSGSVDNPGWRLETIFRTNAQLAYSRGRYEQMTDPDVVDARPYWLFDAIIDGRQTEICAKCDGKVVAADDPWWETHIPPLHFNCRSSPITLTEEEARELGISPKPPTIDAAKGFGDAPPGAHDVGAPDNFTPKAEDYPPELWKAAQAKVVNDNADLPKESAYERHLVTYAHFGEAAKCIAHGKAAEDFGMSLPLAEVLARAENLDHATVREFRGYAETAQLLGVEIKTMAHLKAFVEKTFDKDASFAVDVTAAFVGHREVVVLANKLDAVLKLPESKMEREEAEAEIEASFGFLKNFLAKGIETGPTKLRYEQGRAYYSKASEEIVFDDTSRFVVAHEYGHAMDWLNKSMHERAVAFLQTRTKGEELQKLKELLPKAAYDDDEFTRKDDFFDPYVGKHYGRDGRVTGTEVTSMGIEQLAGFKAAKFRGKDAEHFYFALGQLANRQ